MAMDLSSIVIPQSQSAVDRILIIEVDDNFRQEEAERLRDYWLRIHCLKRGEIRILADRGAKPSVIAEAQEEANSAFRRAAAIAKVIDTS